MKYEDDVWVIIDLRSGFMAESGDNSLPLIFDDEDCALDCADESRFWEAQKAVIRRVGGSQ